jgi:hypothetical protein
MKFLVCDLLMERLEGTHFCFYGKVEKDGKEAVAPHVATE